MSETRIGKIAACHFGHGGYQDACIGVSFTLSSGSWGVSDFWGAWAMNRSDYCKWTEEDRIRDLGEMVMRLAKLLKDAKQDHVSQLVGVPVEVTFDRMRLVSWRVLTEAL